MKQKKTFWVLPVCFLLMVALLTGSFFLLPKESFAENEKRPLSEPPVLSVSTLLDGSFMTQAQTYIADHFPLRETFVGLHAYWQQLLGQNGDSGIYRGKDGFLIARQGDIDLKKEEMNLRAVRQFADANGLAVTWMLVPCAGAMLEDKLPRVHMPYRDDAMLDLVNETCRDDTVLDVRDVFSAADAATLYYRTDHHLTSRGSLLLYEAYCREKALDAQNFSLTQTSDGFYGTAYSKSGLWLQKPDTLEIYAQPDGDYTVTITDGTAVKTSDSLYFKTHLQNLDQYPVFLDGNHGLVQIRNNRCHNGKRLLIFKDSFAHCFATFLAANYEEILMVDLRYHRAPLQDLLESTQPQELLVLYGAENFANAADLAFLSMQ